MSSIVDFVAVSTAGLEASPIAEALAGLRANEARYITNKYDSPFTVSTPDEDPETLRWVTDILREERGIVVASPALEVSGFEADGIRFGYVFYASGLAINVMARRRGQARGRFQAVARYGDPGGTVGLQVRPAALEARRRDPRRLFRDQGRALTARNQARA
jgi:hypothetical protein